MNINISLSLDKANTFDALMISSITSASKCSTNIAQMLDTFFEIQSGEDVIDAIGTMIDSLNVEQQRHQTAPHNPSDERQHYSIFGPSNIELGEKVNAISERFQATKRTVFLAIVWEIANNKKLFDKMLHFNLRSYVDRSTSVIMIRFDPKQDESLLKRLKEFRSKPKHFKPEIQPQHFFAAAVDTALSNKPFLSELMQIYAEVIACSDSKTLTAGRRVNLETFSEKDGSRFIKLEPVLAKHGLHTFKEFLKAIVILLDRNEAFRQELKYYVSFLHNEAACADFKTKWQACDSMADREALCHQYGTTIDRGYKVVQSQAR